MANFGVWSGSLTSAGVSMRRALGIDVGTRAKASLAFFAVSALLPTSELEGPPSEANIMSTWSCSHSSTPYPTQNVKGLFVPRSVQKVCTDVFNIKEVSASNGDPSTGIYLASFFSLLEPEVSLLAGALMTKGSKVPVGTMFIPNGSDVTFMDCSKKCSLSLISLDFEVQDKEKQR